MSANPAPAPEPNPSSSPPGFQVVPAPQPRRHPGALNRKQLAQVELLEVLIPLCRAPDAAGPLGEREVTDALLLAAEDHAKAARAKGTTGANGNVLGPAATLEAGDAKAELMASLRAFQQAARLKYGQADPLQLERHLIGERIDQSRPILQQSAHTIITNTTSDHLPSIEAAMITAAESRLQAYTDSTTPQKQEKAAAKQTRVERDALVAEVIASRQKIQMAAESAWPHTNPANAGMRLKFRLPANQPYVP